MVAGGREYTVVVVLKSEKRVVSGRHGGRRKRRGVECGVSGRHGRRRKHVRGGRKCVCCKRERHFIHTKRKRKKKDIPGIYVRSTYIYKTEGDVASELWVKVLLLLSVLPPGGYINMRHEKKEQQKNATRPDPTRENLPIYVTREQP